ncbi:protein rep (plasmid) [Acinetobacter baumannii]|uniref:protein rep n=1 Tax=Acinetobacter baumannii TaxID=470 RepID=UPI00233F91F5|nr:protein rep [Acinetobacter baumannii]MDC4678430.1 protein rep [Acinetobacter baumannii]MDC4689450.1 protein rep [Acinetobacter baumannii]MDC4721643.1 protein rep [Acinetobacter baumannii]
MPNSLKFTKVPQKLHFAEGALASSEGSSAKKSGALGKLTKSQATPVNKGFQRSHSFVLQDQSAKLLPQERVCNCLKRRIDKNKNRTVMFNENRETTAWGNLMRCGSLWSCPVCAKQITEERRAEMRKLLEYWEKQENSDIKLMTLTFSHSQNESLSVLKKKLGQAITMFFGGREFKELSKLCKVQHKVRSFEVTYGSNGWHPHFHILLLTNDVDDLAYAYRDRLSKYWIHCCKAKGLKSPSMEHGLDIRDGSYAQEYVAKWGLDYEMTKGHVKRGRKESLSPFDILQLSIEDKEVFGKSPSKLWQEFAIAMKGARQLVWGRGLKDLVGINDKTDEEIANETDKESITLREVDQVTFDLLSKYQKRHEFLEWQKRDFLNGCYGSGETEENLILLFERFISELPDDQGEFFHVCKNIV